MLPKVIKIYFFSTLAFILIGHIQALSNGSVEYPVFYINLITLISYSFILSHLVKEQSIRYFTKSRLVWMVFTYSIVFLIIYKFYYYIETGDFWELSARDSLIYDYESRMILKNGFINGFKLYIKNGGDIEDLGAIITTTISYLLYPSPLSFNLLNIILGVISIIILFDLIKKYLDIKSAFIAALSYGIASFTVYHYSTGMKETIFSTLVILIFRQFQLWIEKKQLVSMFNLTLFIALIYFFRPQVLIMIILSLAFGIIFSKKRSLGIYLISIILLSSIGIYFSSFFINNYQYYLRLTSTSSLINSASIEPTLINFIYAFISSIFGPLPSYINAIWREQQAFYSIGLGFRVLLTPLFIYGIISAFKQRNALLIAVSTFTIIEMIVLASILESFELRLNLPHIFAIYLLAFVGLKNIHLNNQFRSTFNIVLGLKLSIILLVGLLFIWNSRFFNSTFKHEKNYNISRRK